MIDVGHVIFGVQRFAGRFAGQDQKLVQRGHVRVGGEEELFENALCEAHLQMKRPHDTENGLESVGEGWNVLLQVAQVANHHICQVVSGMRSKGIERG